MKEFRATDTKIIYEAYQRAKKRIYVNPSKNANDKKALVTLSSKLPLMITQLSMDNISITEVTEIIPHAKGILNHAIRICVVKRNRVSNTILKNIETLIDILSHREAELIEYMRVQYPWGDKIDLKAILSNDKNLRQLMHICICEVVKNVINSKTKSIGNTKALDLYITETGHRYHVKNCKYCNGKQLMKASIEAIENMKLTPCKCIEVVKYNSKFITVYIDESIRNIKWSTDGEEGLIGGFSYIICRGYITNEVEIDSSNIIAQGTGFTDEIKCVDRITQSAIGKVMLSLIYDFSYSGDVLIYTDNTAAQENWTHFSKNSKLAKSFNSVSVKYISRNKNTKADKLVRSRVYMDLPYETYTQIVEKCEAYDKSHMIVADGSSKVWNYNN